MLLTVSEPRHARLVDLRRPTGLHAVANTQQTCQSYIPDSAPCLVLPTVSQYMPRCEIHDALC